MGPKKPCITRDGLDNKVCDTSPLNWCRVLSINYIDIHKRLFGLLDACLSKKELPHAHANHDFTLGTTSDHDTYLIHALSNNLVQFVSKKRVGGISCHLQRIQSFFGCVPFWRRPPTMTTIQSRWTRNWGTLQSFHQPTYHRLAHHCLDDQKAVV